MIFVCRKCYKTFIGEGNRVFCSPKCRIKFHSDKFKREYRRKKRFKKPHAFPFYVCSCGNKFQLDFFPLERKVWTIECPKCNKKRYTS